MCGCSCEESPLTLYCLPSAEVMTKLLPDWLRHPWIVCDAALELVELLCCEVEDDVLELGCCVCCCVWSWGVLVALPEVDELSCATANVAASKNVAEVKRMRFFMLPPFVRALWGFVASPRR